jgi:hypothetical protein
VTKSNLIAFAMLAIFSSAAFGHRLPSPEKLEALIENTPTSIKVYEPHMSTPGYPYKVEYMGFPADVVLSKVFGPAWWSVEGDYEFRALEWICIQGVTNFIKKI